MNVQNFDHSHHKLSLRGLSSPPDVLSFEGREQLSEPFCYDIQFTSSDKAIAPEAVLMQDGSFSLCAPLVQGMPVQVPLRTLHGVVTGFRQLSSSRDEARYEVRLEPRLALLSRSHQNAIYQNQSVPQIVEKILRERHGMRGQDFVFRLSGEFPSREQVMQYGEDDLTFISRLLAEVGIWFCFSTDTRLKTEVVEFYDDQSGYGQGPVLPLCPQSGMSDSGKDAVWGLNTVYSVVPKSVTTRDYNYRTATAAMTSELDVTGGDGTTCGEAYHYADNFLKTGDQKTPESGAFYARIRHERYLNGRAVLGGQSTCALLRPGQAINVQGDDVPGGFRQGVLITGITAGAARDRSLELRFSAIPCSERYGFRPPLIPKPVMAGTLPARVTSTTANDIYAHIDKDGRYRVNLDFDRDTWKPGYESLWVRQSRPYAGDTYGLHLPLLAGTEVSIAFEEGNPDRPYIAGVKHDSAHTEHVTIQNYKRNVLRTPANNKIRLDDERGKEHIKVSTEYGGKSQLNLGHLVDSQKTQRGEGFELRTDMWGAIRAKKGIFISADGQDKAQGQALDMQAAIAQLENALSVVHTLFQSSEIAKAHSGDKASQERLSESLISLKRSGILLHAPEGIGISSPEALRLSSGSASVGIVAGQNADISVLKKFTVAAGEAVSLLAQKVGMKLFAAKGKVEIQAQSDAIEAIAQKDIKITSTEGVVTITAAKELVLNCAGAYIRLNDSGVEIGCPNNILFKCANAQKMGPADYDSPMPDLPKGFSEYFIARNEDSGEIMPHTRYRITTAEGSIFEGITDREGKTVSVYTGVPNALKIQLF